MGFDRDVSQRYDGWYGSPWGEYADRAEKRLLDRLARPPPGESGLDFGCGTGRYLEWLHAKGLRVTGVDASPDMIMVARRRLAGAGARGRAFVADAGSLPFGADSFDLVVAVTSLEFMQTPEAALREMARVCRRRLFLGVLSRSSLYARRVRRKGPASSLAKARLYSVRELVELVRSALGSRPCVWRTGLLAPEMQSRVGAALARSIDRIPGVDRLPWGAYIGLVADPR